MAGILTSVAKGWLHNEGGFIFDEAYYMDPLHRVAQDKAIDAFLQARFPQHPFYNLESNLVQIDYCVPNQVLVGGMQPNLIVGACLGAEFIFYPDKDMDIAGQPLQGLASAEDLPAPASLLQHPLVKQLDSQIAELQATGDYHVIPPFFWDTSGRATIHGILTTSQKLYGEGIFLRFFDDPDFVQQFHLWIADVYITLIQHFSALANLPITSVHVGECSGAMVRAEDYSTFITPGISKLGRELGPIRLHSCGLSDHLLAAIMQIDNLSILDTGSNTSIAAIRQQYGPDFPIDFAPPVELLLPGVEMQALEAWVAQVLADNAGGPLNVGFHFEPGYSLENCLALHDIYRRATEGETPAC